MRVDETKYYLDRMDKDEDWDKLQFASAKDQRSKYDCALSLLEPTCKTILQVGSAFNSYRKFMISDNLEYELHTIEIIDEMFESRDINTSNDILGDFQKYEFNQKFDAIFIISTMTFFHKHESNAMLKKALSLSDVVIFNTVVGLPMASFNAYTEDEIYEFAIANDVDPSNVTIIRPGIFPGVENVMTIKFTKTT